METIGFLTRQIRSVEKAVLPKVKLRPEFEILKNGNRYLSWAYVEAANFAVRYPPRAKAFHQRKCAKAKKVVAIKALANKLARASFYILRDQCAFDEKRLYG